MTRLLYLEASPRKDRSKSIGAAKKFLDAYRATHAGDEIETLDLWKMTLPEFDGATINAKYKVIHGKGHSADEATAWQAVVDLCEQFKSADKYLISTPMWNFGIPYKLKHYIDLITQPGQTFSFSPETGYSGLVTGKPIVCVYARGGAYSSAETQAMDYQKSYLEFLLGFIGFTDIRSIVIEPTLAAPDDVAKKEAEASQLAAQLAKSF